MTNQDLKFQAPGMIRDSGSFCNCPKINSCICRSRATISENKIQSLIFQVAELQWNLILQDFWSLYVKIRDYWGYSETQRAFGLIQITGIHKTLRLTESPLPAAPLPFMLRLSFPCLKSLEQPHLRKLPHASPLPLLISSPDL